jgi:D-glycero-alpha-D-manno-heptose-7-phosphate kinase
MMVISRAPLRMSFAGGGSDLPAFYREFGGAVLSTAIDKYVYVTVNTKFDHGVRIGYSKNEEVDSIDSIEHPLVKAAMRLVGLHGGIEITTIADVPSRGTGLGSSSSFTVGLLQALYAYLGQYASAEKLSRDGCAVEIDICGEPIGKQDQYAAAHGGFNYISFSPDDSVAVCPIVCRPDTIKSIHRNIMVFYTGIVRSASSVLKAQNEGVAREKDKQRTLCRMTELAATLRDAIQADNVDAFGEILHENWELKKTLADGISSPDIDDYYKAARAAGATGGKILGAGNGGFLMVFAPEAAQNSIKATLSKLRLVEMNFEPLGSRIIFSHG